MSITYEFRDEALRLLANLEQRYGAWMDSSDEGQTWETNWVMKFQREKTSARSHW